MNDRVQADWKRTLLSKGVHTMFRHTVLSAMVVLIAHASLSAEIFTFDGPGTRWDIPGNWDQNDIPGAGDIAIIPTTFTCQISNNFDAAALRIELKAGTGVAAGLLKVYQGSSLTLHGNGESEASVIAGMLSFEDDEGSSIAPLLKVSHSHVIKAGINVSSPGFIKGNVEGVIDESDDNAVLTLVTTPDNVLEVTGKIDIKVELVNNATVNGLGGPLNLSTGDKSGTGVWKATQGTLNVNCALTGAGVWEAGASGTINIDHAITVDADANDPTRARIKILNGGSFIVNAAVSGSTPWILQSGTLQINEACSVTGDITQSGGTLDLNATFCTTGKLTHSGGTLDVAQGSGSAVTFSWGGNCP